MRAFAVILSVLFTQILFSQNSDWVQVNPNPQNDFYAIKFFNQTTGYVIGSGGVILKNTTGTSNWITIPSGTVNDLYGMYFFDINHGYIVGAGGLIMYTSDGGVNWTHLVTSNGYALRSITFVNQNTGFIVGDHGELYKTSTGLYGWIPSAVTTKNLRKIVAPDSLHIYASGDSGTFLRSVNGGLNWTTVIVNSGNIYALGFRDSLNGFLSSYNTANLRTNDGGLTWSSSGFYWNSMYMSIRFLNANTGFACGIGDPITRTTNGGLNWATWGSGYLLGGDAIYDISPIDSFHVICCGLRGFIIKSTDTGNGYNNYQIPIGGARFSLSNVSFLNANTGEVIGNSTYLYTTNGGQNWSLSLIGYNSWFEGSSSMISATMIPPLSAYRTIYTPGVGGFPSISLQNSSDGGVTWNGPFGFGSPGYGLGGFCEVQGTAYLINTIRGIMRNTGSGGWVNLYNASYDIRSISFANLSTGIVCGGGPTPGILRSTNAGTNWTFLSSGNNHIAYIAILRPSGVGFIAGDSSYVMRTYDYGANWTLLSQNGNQRILDMKFATDNIGWFRGQRGYAPFDTCRLFYTNNGGSNFVQFMSLMNFNVRGFTFVDENTGYVCGDSGVVLKTTNGGITFVNPAIENLPHEYSLSQNFPNPFNPSTTIKFDIPNYVKRQTSNVKLIIYDVTGREVVKLIDQQMQPGNYSVDWDASSYPSGVYFYKLEAGEYRQSRKMILIK